MAGWRRAVELAMTNEEIERLTVANRAGEPGIAGADAVGLSRESFVLCGGAKRRGPPSNGSALRGAGAGLYGRWRPSRIDHGRAKNRLSRRGQSPSRSAACDKAKEHGDRMSCGRRGFWRVTHASTDRRRGTNVSLGWFKARCARSSARRKSSRTRCATIWNVAMPSSSRRWRRFCAFIARSRF